MIIKEINLKNIRSYTEETISFPKGSVLLSGDIGSGKSTILYAIEFALFGIRRDLPGSALLRKGKKRGAVSLTFQIADKVITITRTLKRTKDTVNQGSGTLTSNKQKKELTPTELTAKILSLLGYPPELLSRKKSQIYRYTVYTPQEQMKIILNFDEETRYDTLRKVFGIDKYKRIKNNAEDLLREIRARLREFKVLIDNLSGIGRKQEESLEKKSKLEQKIRIIQEKLRKIRATEMGKSEIINKLDSDLKALHELEKQIQSLKVDRKNREENKSKDNQQFKAIQENLVQFKENLKTYHQLKPPCQLSESELEVKINQLRDDERAKLRRSSQLEEKIRNLKNIFSQGTCPLCEQPVANPESFREKINLKIKDKEEIDVQIINCKKEAEKLKLWQNQLRDYQQKLKEKENLQERITDLEKQLLTFQKQIKESSERIGEIDKSLQTLQQKLPQYANLEIKKNQVNESLEKIRQERIERERESAALQQEFVDNENKLEEIKEQLTKRAKAKRNCQKLNQYENWVKNYFIELMSIIETYVMVNLQKNFDLLFQDWFNKLVNDGTINVHIDEHFSPIIEQNGYQINYDYLSGGERTSVALAYRLALNKIVNSLTKDLQTKDLIILDEPTDGFSTSQMDSIRSILEELGTQQTIIVSHEPKIEGFVENVIKVEKRNHQSTVA